MKTSSFINRRFICLLRRSGNKTRFTAFRYSSYIITIIILTLASSSTSNNNRRRSICYIVFFATSNCFSGTHAILLVMMQLTRIKGFTILQNLIKHPSFFLDAPAFPPPGPTCTSRCLPAPPPPAGINTVFAIYTIMKITAYI